MTDAARTPLPAVETDEDVRLEIIETVRRFVAREVTPVAADLERADEFPAEIVAQMRDLGLFGVTIPESRGGLGLDLRTYIGVIEELAYGWMSLTGIINTHTMCATLIMYHGSPEQQQRLLPSMATGERRGALSLSEPDAGSDTRNISCRATPTARDAMLMRPTSSTPRICGRPRPASPMRFAAGMRWSVYAISTVSTPL